MTKTYAIDTEELCLKLLEAIGEDDCLSAFTEIIAQYFDADAVSILEYKAPKLQPVALFGLSKETFGRRLDIADNPRLSAIVYGDQATIFNDDVGLGRKHIIMKRDRNAATK